MHTAFQPARRAALAFVTALTTALALTACGGGGDEPAAAPSPTPAPPAAAPTQWSLQATLKPSNLDAADSVGSAMAMDGDTLVVGVPKESSNQRSITNGSGASSSNSAVGAGAVYVFIRAGGLWVQQAYLKAPNAKGGDAFGTSVAISGDTIVVGARGEDSAQNTVSNGNGASEDNTAFEAGAAYVFVRTAGNWTQQAYLKAANNRANMGFGGHVAISGDTVVVGAPNEDSSQTTITPGGGASSDVAAPDAGAAYVFVRSGGNWAQQAYLKAPNAGSGDLFGTHTAISGDTIVVGAPGEDAGQNTVTNGSTAASDNAVSNAGAAYVFVRSGSTWTAQAYLKAANAGADDAFGQQVALQGDTVVVGAPNESSGQTSITNGSTASTDDLAQNAGAAYVFVRTGASWAQQAYLKANNAERIDLFGNSLALHGDTLVVGAPGENSATTAVLNAAPGSSDNSAADAGAAYVFVRTGTSWAQQAYLKANNTSSSDFFGTAVAVSGHLVAVGAPLEDGAQPGIVNDGTPTVGGGATNAGAVYSFQRQ